MKRAFFSKKKTSLIICVILAAVLLTACASGGSYDATINSWDPAPEAPMAAPMPAPMPEADMMYIDDVDFMYSDAAGGTDTVLGVVPVSEVIESDFSEKIIYSVFADIETMKFDETIENVHVLMASYNAFIENSSVSGVNYASRYYGWVELRYAHFSLRVPKENLDAITRNLGTLGNVVHESSNAMNITSQFYDTQSRLNSLMIQEERLLDMLSQAVDVPDLIMIEKRLSDVRYQVESLVTILNNWQSQVDYSTLTINIREVEQFTEQVQIYRTYWEEMFDGFISTLEGTGRFFMNLFKWIVVSAPVLIILAVLAIIVAIIVKKSIHSSKRKRSLMPGNAAVNPYVPPAGPYAPPAVPYAPPAVPENTEQDKPEEKDNEESGQKNEDKSEPEEEEKSE